MELLHMIYGKGDSNPSPIPEMTPAGPGVVSGKLRKFAGKKG